MEHFSSEFVGKVTRTWENKFDARIERAMHGDGLSVVSTVYDGQPTIKYGFQSVDDAIGYIRSLGFDGVIIKN